MVCCERLLHKFSNNIYLPCSMVQLRGNKVCIVEKRRVEGRNQEWNVSRHELQASKTMLLLLVLTLQGRAKTAESCMHFPNTDCFQ